MGPAQRTFSANIFKVIPNQVMLVRIQMIYSPTLIYSMKVEFLLERSRVGWWKTTSIDALVASMELFLCIVDKIFRAFGFKGNGRWNEKKKVWRKSSAMPCFKDKTEHNSSPQEVCVSVYSKNTPPTNFHEFFRQFTTRTSSRLLHLLTQYIIRTQSRGW